MEILPLVTSLTLVVSSIVLYVLFYYKRKFSYWKKRGIPYLKPDLVFGNTKNLIYRRVPIPFEYQRIYNELEGHKFGGFYQLTTPMLMIRDPDLVKDVLIKHFAHFHDHGFSFDEDIEPLTAHVVSLKGQRWKGIRQKLTPTFSTGKLRLMQDLMNDCIEELNKYLTKAIDGTSGSGSEQNLKELTVKFATDVIGACAFGFQCNAIREADSEFRRIGRLIFSFAGCRVYIHQLLSLVSARLIRLFNVKVISPEVEEFFLSMVNEAARHREAGLQKRNNFLHLMSDLQAEEQDAAKEHSDASPGVLFTDNVVAANAMLFFIAGFESVSSTLSFCMYELALNPDICQRVRDEVEAVKQAHNGHLDYDAMRELVFMDAVLSETLRKYPAFNSTTRKCTEPFRIPDTSIVVEKDTIIHMSFYSLHHDPKYFPEPDKFLPERFSPENKESIKPGTFYPYSEGPRNCLGMRFAQFEMKSVLSHIVANYTLHPCDKTSIPLKFSCKANELGTDDGIWIRFERRIQVYGK